MNYSLTKISQEEGLPKVQLGGHLTIRNAQVLHAELLEYASKHEGLHLEVKETGEIDVAFMQILLSLSAYLYQHNKAFFLQMELDPEQTKMLQIAGLKEKLTINA